MTENQATAGAGALPTQDQWRPSALMTEYSEPSPTAQNATGPESNEGQTSAVSGTESVPATPSEGAAAPQFNADSPEARHFQAISDRNIAKVRAESDAALAAVRAELAAVKAQLSSPPRAPENPTEQSSQNSSGLALDWSKAPRFTAPEGGYFDDATVEAINRAADEKIRWTIEQIQQNSAQQAAQAQASAADQAIVGFARTLDAGPQEAFVGLFRENPAYEGIARADPQGFIEFAKVRLGIGASESAAAPAPPKLAQHEQVIPSSRPTQNRASVAAKFAPGTTLEDKIRANVRRAMGS